MTLAAASRLGSYKILAPLGAGGMGEVYRARDTRLGREVAIKVLPEKFSEDRERIARLEREAKSLAAVGHPNIAALFSFEEVSGRHLLVMELAEGQTLAERLLKGPLPLDQALRYATEMAMALDAAHRHGIVHRDLKPGNVMLTRSGVKLLDFGLAKAAARPVAPSAPTSLPTEPPRDLTQEGTILGTLQYMAPEQLEGREADARTDIFAFGAVLYEMTTGKKAFSGSSQASLISAIMSGEPAPLTTLQPMTPPALDQLVKRCLAKDPDERWDSAHDVAGQLKWIAETVAHPSEPLTPPSPVKGRRRRRQGALAVAIALLTSIVTVVAVRVLTREAHPSPKSVVRFVMVPPWTEPPLARDYYPVFAISPDGTWLVYVGWRADKAQLYLRRMERLETRRIEGTENAYSPFLSPDAQWVGFFADGKLKKVPLTGGSPETVCDASGFSPDGRWVASAGDDKTIRLWPVPDVTKTPPHMRSHEEFLATLRSWTNVRAVPDAKSATGWKLETGRFPGWQNVPHW